MSLSGPLLQRHSFWIILGKSTFYRILFHPAVRLLLGFVLIDDYHSIFARCAHRSLLVRLLFAFFVLPHSSRKNMLHPCYRHVYFHFRWHFPPICCSCFASSLALTLTWTKHSSTCALTITSSFFQPLFGNDLARTSSSLPLFVFFLHTNFKASLRWLFLHPLAASAFAVCQSLILAANPIAWCQFSHDC